MGSITLPNGAVATSNYGNVAIFQYPKCILVYHSYSAYYYYFLNPSYAGIYTCNILSIGFYNEGNSKCIAIELICVLVPVTVIIQ